MKKLSKEEIQKIARIYYFDIDDKYLDFIYNDFSSFLERVEQFSLLNLDGVEPTDYCTEHSCNELREDEPVIEPHPEEFTKNAKNKLDKYIVIK